MRLDSEVIDAQLAVERRGGASGDLVQLAEDLHGRLLLQRHGVVGLCQGTREDALHLAVAVLQDDEHVLLLLSDMVGASCKNTRISTHIHGLLQKSK